MRSKYLSNCGAVQSNRHSKPTPLDHSITILERVVQTTKKSLNWLMHSLALTRTRSHGKSSLILIMTNQKEITSTNPLFYASLVEAVRDLDLLDLGDASEVDIQRIVHCPPPPPPRPRARRPSSSGPLAGGLPCHAWWWPASGYRPRSRRRGSPKPGRTKSEAIGGVEQRWNPTDRTVDPRHIETLTARAFVEIPNPA